MSARVARKNVQFQAAGGQCTVELNADKGCDVYVDGEAAEPIDENTVASLMTKPNGEGLEEMLDLIRERTGKFGVRESRMLLDAVSDWQVQRYS